MAEIKTWKRKVKGRYRYGVGTREFATEAQATQHWLDLKNKANKPEEVKFANPVTGQTETALDSSAYKQRIDYLDKTQKKDLRDRRQKLVENIFKNKTQISLTKNKDKANIMQADIDAWESELEEISSTLGQSYQRGSGDATIDQSGGGFIKGIKDFFTPSEEDSFKSKIRKEKMGQVARGEVELPEGVSGYQWAKDEADRLWNEKTNQKPLSEQSIEELIKGAESDGK